MAHAAASIKKVRESEIEERERNLEKERKRQRKISRADRKRKVRGGKQPPSPFPPTLPLSVQHLTGVRCRVQCSPLHFPDLSHHVSLLHPFTSLLSPSAVRFKCCQPWQPTATQETCTERWHAGVSTFPSSQKAWSSLPWFPARCSEPLADLEKLSRQGGGCACALQREGAFLYFPTAFLPHFPFLVPFPTSSAGLSAVCRTRLGGLGASAELCCSFWVPPKGFWACRCDSVYLHCSLQVYLSRQGLAHKSAICQVFLCY